MSSTESTYSSSSSEDNTFKGLILNNKYLILYKLGEGSFASVWLALNVASKKYYAIKMQHYEDYESAMEEIDLLKKFKDEKCEYVNRLVESFKYKHEDDEYMCMVLELMAGSLYDITKRGTYSKGLPLPTVKKVIKQLLTAIDLIQTKYKILHSDIKPDNVLVVGQSNKIKELIEIYDKQLPKKINNKIKDQITKIDVSKIEKKYDKKTTKCIENIYVDNIRTKLADFGNCKKINYSKYDIQTRYYRAPEIILGYRYNANCDIWSVGCMIFELLTGLILFDPDKFDRFNRDRSHLYCMIQRLGKVPQELISKSKYKSNFFKTNGQLKGDLDNIKYKPLFEVISAQLKDRKDCPDEQIILTTDLMYKLLDYDPYKRPDPKLILTHKWFF